MAENVASVLIDSDDISFPVIVIHSKSNGAADQHRQAGRIIFLGKNHFAFLIINAFRLTALETALYFLFAQIHEQRSPL